MNKRFKINFLLIICGFFLSSISYAQHPGYYQLNDETGLPSNEVYKVIQDEFGYIWIGCDAGLYRYDGFTYKKYTSSKQNSNAVSFLIADRFNNIWCKNFYGQIFRVDGDSLRLVAEIKTSNPAFPPFDVDEKGNLWTCDDSVLINFSVEGKRLHEFNFPKNKRVTGLKCKSKVLYLVFTDFSVSKFNLDVQIYQSLFEPLEITGQCRTFIDWGKEMRVVMESDQLKSKFSIIRISGNDVSGPSIIDIKNDKERIFSIFPEKENLWFTSSYGVFNSGNFDCYLFPEAKVSSMMKDREGQYWFSTLQNGIYVVPEMDVLKYNSSNSNVTENNLVSIFGQANDLFLGSYSGEIFHYITLFDEHHPVYSDNSRSFFSVKCIVKNEKYTIISRGHLCIIDNSNGKQYFPPTSNIKDMFLLDDTLYMVQSNYIAKASISEMIKTNSVINIFLNKTGGKAVEYDNVNKKFYYLLRDGLFIYENGVLNEIKINGRSVLGNEMQFSNDIIWVSGATEGIYAFKNKKLAHHFTNKNKLKENLIRTFYAEEDRLWVCTENYLQSISLTNNKISTYSTFHSINSKDINKILVSEYKVYLATNKGMVTFPTDLKWKNSTRPEISIVQILLDGKPIEYADEFQLLYDNNNLRFELSSISLKSRGKYYYEYQLLGLDDKWNRVEAQNHFIQFSSIPPGNYELKIRAINESGVASKIISYYISVEFPFWQRWWFYLLIGISASALVGMFFIIRIRYLRKKNETKNKMLLSQLTALKSRMNPHFMFNSLNSIQHLIVKQDVKQSNLYISKFGKLMRQILDVSGKEKISLQEEIEILELYMDLEKLRFGDDFKYELVFHEHLNTYQIDIPPMILQPFVENAIKHGLLHKKGEKHLKIEFKKEKDLICIITDNGIGRKKSEEIKKRQNPEHESFATKATQEQMELLQEYYHESYRFEIEDLMNSGEAVGTKVTIHMQVE